MIDVKQLQKVGVDYDAGLKRFMNDAALYEKVLNAFVRSDVLERAREAYKVGDMNSLYAAMHEAKGAGGNADLPIVHDTANTVVVLLRQSHTGEELAEAFACFDTAYSTILYGIRHALGIVEGESEK